MELLFWMIVGHFLADFGLQSYWVASNKGKHFLVLLAHSMIWTGAVMLPVTVLSDFHILHAVFLLLGHAALDYGKCCLVSGLGYYEKSIEMDKDLEKTIWRLITVDQLGHVCQILLVWYLV